MRIFVISTVLLAACGGTQRPEPQPPGSRGPHASEHLTAASEHEEAARQRSMYPDTRTTDGTGRTDQLLVGTTWHTNWDTVADQQRAAAIHRSEADAIYAGYHEACGDTPISEISVSPIVKYGVGGTTTANGVVLYLSNKAGTADQLMAALKCHRAWMRLAPANMDACPLDLAGLQVDAKGSPDGITLTLSVDDKRLVPELQRRAARDLEMGSGHRHH